jgi:DNA-binding beta-propeller fold protein YncE
MKQIRYLSILILAFALMAGSVGSAFALSLSNGQAAGLVLGEPDFATSSCQVTQAGMCGPTSVAVDPTTGKVFVSDYWNNRVLRYASVLALTNGSAAQAVLGQPDFTSNTHATTQNGMYQPWGVTVDSTGRLWVADLENSRVLRFDNASAKASDANADGVLGQPNFTSSAAAATQSGMDNPWGVVVDSAGRLWVGDESNNRVLRFDSAASKANGAKANAVLGQTNFTNHASAASQSRMYNPGPMVLDSSGRLWVVDFGNNRVLRFNTAASKANGANADGVLGQPNFTSSTARTTQGGMSAPEGIALDSSGKLWVSDNANYRILGFTNAASLANGSKASSMLGQLYYGASLCLTTPSGLCYPTGIFYDHAAGVLWVADFDNNRVVMYNHP